MEKNRLIEGLTQLTAYPHLDGANTPPEVEVLETHISVLFFAGERVFKTKKPVELGFLDYRQLDRRRHFCEEELRLGKQLSPSVYLGLAPICCEADGSLRLHGQGEPVEWAVEMRRLPARDMLAAKLERGEIDNELLGALALRLVDFHERAATGVGIDEFGSLATLRTNTEENWEQLRPWIEFPGEPREDAPLVSSALYSFLKSDCRSFLEEHEQLLERRVREGRIREGHGDLHAGNICVTEGALELYDRIEFNRRFRCGDVAADLAFLAMDLDHSGFAAFSSFLVKRYAELAGDRELAQLMPFYKSYRAVVRAKVAAFASLGLELGEPRRATLENEARGYFHLAAAYQLPPALILMCGLSGTGKSWVAGRLQRPLHALRHQSDVRRKQLANAACVAAGETGYELGLYSPELKARTYRDLLEVAGQGLAAGRSVIVDATFSSAATRAPFLDLAARLGLQSWVVLVEAPEELVHERLDARAADPREASDATYDIYLKQRESFEPPDELPPGHVVPVISSDESCKVPAARLIEHMITLSGA